MRHGAPSRSHALEPPYDKNRVIQIVSATLTLLTFSSGLAVGSGGLVGFVLGLIGGGGSILAVPLLVYLVGVQSPHVAIGTGALAVAVNATTGLVAHARAGTVKWRCAAVFAVAGVAGAFIGSAFGKAMNGQTLLALFGVLMIAVGLSVLVKSSPPNGCAGGRSTPR